MANINAHKLKLHANWFKFGAVHRQRGPRGEREKERLWLIKRDKEIKGKKSLLNQTHSLKHNSLTKRSDSVVSWTGHSVAFSEFEKYNVTSEAMLKTLKLLLRFRRLKRKMAKRPLINPWIWLTVTCRNHFEVKGEKKKAKVLVTHGLQSKHDLATVSLLTYKLFLPVATH